MLQTKLVSSLDKPFLDESIACKTPYTKASALKGELFSFQLLYQESEIVQEVYGNERLTLEISSELKEWITVRTVESVANAMPCWPSDDPSDYLRTQPGMYPDLLLPLRDDVVPAIGTNLHSVWVDIDLPETVRAGAYSITLTLTPTQGGESRSETFMLRIMDAVLPKSDTYVTQWFHADCLANYYQVPVFSEKHWEICENFMRNAAKHGQTAIYLPLVTPPLDTAVGGERTTVQLLDITLKNGEYEFGFEKVDRWCDLAVSIGFQWFEVVHLFTQWGAEHAPKVIAKIDGKDTKIFGWETDAVGQEYRTFVRALLKAFLAHMRQRGQDGMCVFHISDEPSAEHLEAYRKAKESVVDLLAGYRISDALSNFEFYKQGVIETPTPSSDHIQPFLDAKVKGLHVYYCCGQRHRVSNRFLAMPGYSARILGTQMFRNRVNGFLQWGYNFYNNRFSTTAVDPWQTNTADYFVPAGDTFQVYPGADGKPVETMHYLQFAQALQDLRALKKCALVRGEDFVDALIDAYGQVTFDVWPRGEAYILELREKINQAIAE